MSDDHSPQIDETLTKSEAESYLAWLDAGNVGHHWDALGRRDYRAPGKGF